MKYKASKMLKKSRFKDYVKTLTNEEYDITLKYVNKLIDENKEYTDKQNYGYLCNLFVSMSLVWMHMEKGKTKIDSQKIVFDAMHKYLKPKVKSMQNLAKHKFFVPMLKKIMPIKIKKQCGYGWDIVFPKTSKYKFSMTTNKCIFAQIFEKYGMKEMTKGFCLVDNLMYSELPHTKFSYSQRIGEGGSFCDYSFERED
jgi:hypothetical protein